MFFDNKRRIQPSWRFGDDQNTLAR